MLTAREIEICSVLILVAAALAPGVLFARRVFRIRYTLMLHLLSLLNVIYTRIVWRGNVLGRIDLPPGQGAVVVCNHRSSVDPAFIALTSDRMVYWMVAKEYFAHPLFGWFLRSVGGIPTRRGGVDTAATREAIRTAADGKLLGVLPEGRINNTDEFMLPGRPGVALIALKARVPVVPCYIEGTPFDGTVHGCLFMRARAALRVGRSIDLSEFYGRENEKPVLEHLTLRFMKEIAKLAGRDDYEPKLAGRRWRRHPAAL